MRKRFGPGSSPGSVRLCTVCGRPAVASVVLHRDTGERLRVYTCGRSHPLGIQVGGFARGPGVIRAEANGAVPDGIGLSEGGLVTQQAGLDAVVLAGCQSEECPNWRTPGLCYGNALVLVADTCPKNEGG